MAVIDRRDPDALSDDTRPPGTPIRRKALIAGTLFTAAWLIPLGLNAFGLDWIVLVLLLLGTASLLTAGHSLLDRLVISTILLAGLLIAGGVIFSLWPWGLEPVPIAGFSLTCLVLTGLVLRLRYGRSPRIPTRVRGSDLIIVAAPILAWYLATRPVTGRDFTRALPYLLKGHDGLNHYSLFDAIHRINGYQVFHHAQAARYLGEMINYQPGAHYLYVLVDNFRRSSTDPGTSTAEFVRYSQYETLGYCLLALALPWAARWVAGPVVRGYRRVLICSVVAAIGVFGQFIALFWYGFDPAVLGLAILAVTFAIIARPPRNPNEQVLLAGSALTALAFTYCLFLVNAVVLVLAAYLAYRDRILRVKKLAIVTAALTVLLALIPLGGSLTMHSLGDLFSEDGAFVDFSRPLSVALGLIAMSAVLTHIGRRSLVWRISVVVVGSSCAVAVAAELAGRIATGQAMYYSSKLVESAMVCSLCGFGALGLFLKDSPHTVGRDKRSLGRTTGIRAIWGSEFLTGAVAVLLGLVLAEGFPMSGHYEVTGYQPQTTSDAVFWARGRIVPRWYELLADYAKAAPLDDGRRTIVALAAPRYNFMLTLFVNVLNHNIAGVDLTGLQDFRPPREAVLPSPDNAFVLLNSLDPSATTDSLTEPQANALRLVEGWLRRQPNGLRVAVASSGFATLLNQFAAQNPRLGLDVVYVTGVTQSDWR